ncbi:MAG: hypothetical protein KatS3mg104_1755 [Phycisphaerae bacterium]|nr:MAG: hypothetical protein KatS3mg104_1755 [Phycisphaerae bacterium]
MNWWMKIKIWTKIGVFSIIAVYIFLFSIKNLGTKTELWIFFGQGWTIESSVLLLAVGAFVCGIISTLMVRTILRTMSQLREMKRKRAEKEAIAILNRAAKLRTRDSLSTGDSAVNPARSEDVG